MSDIWVPVIAAVGGGLVASLATIVTVILQSRATRREMLGQLAVNAGIEEHKRALEYASTERRSVMIPPLSAFVVYHASLLRLLDNKERVSTEDVRTLNEEWSTILKVFDVSS